MVDVEFEEVIEIPVEGRLIVALRKILDPTSRATQPGHYRSMNNHFTSSVDVNCLYEVYSKVCPLYVKRNESRLVRLDSYSAKIQWNCRGYEQTTYETISHASEAHIPCIDAYERVNSILQEHMNDFYDEYLKVCGWDMVNNGNVERKGRVVALRWPWELYYVDHECNNSAKCHVIRGRGKSITTNVITVKHPYECRSKLLNFITISNDAKTPSGFVDVNDGTVQVFDEKPFIIDMISRLTDATKHDLFSGVRQQSGATLISKHPSCVDGTQIGVSANGDCATDLVTSYCCNAEFAFLLRGGLYLFFVPGDGTTINSCARLRGFVGCTPDVLFRQPTAANASAGGVLFFTRPVVQTEDAYHKRRPQTFTTKLSDTDLVKEMKADEVLGRMKKAGVLREFGVSVSSTRSTWPYRAAFCSQIAQVLQKNICYAEYAGTEDRTIICTSNTKLVFLPDGGCKEESNTMELTEGARDVFWDGSMWALIF